MDCVRIGVGSFLIQAESVREEIKTKFFRSRQILTVKESDLLSELDQLVASYKGVRTIGLIEELNQKKEFLENFEHNEIQATIVKSVAVMDARIRELKTSLETTVARMKSVELRWDGELENKLDQIGWIWVEYEENIQDPTSRLGEDSSLDEDYDWNGGNERKDDSKEIRQNPNFMYQYSIIKSPVVHGVLIPGESAKEKLSLQDEREFYKAKAIKYKEHMKKSRSDLEEMNKEFEQFKMKYNAYNQKLLQVEEKLNILRSTQDHFSSQIEPNYLRRSIDSNLSTVSSIQEEIDRFPSDTTLPPPKSVINKNKLEYLPTPDIMSVRNFPEIVDVPSDIKGDGLKLYNPTKLKRHINITFIIIYIKNPIKTVNLSSLKNPDSHKDDQVIVKVEEIYRLGYLKVILSKKFIISKILSKIEVIAGIRLQESCGNSNGVYESVKHFDCPPNYAIFIPINEVFVPVF